MSAPESSGVREWIDARWDGPARLRAFLGKPLPRNISWLHTLGSLLLLYLGFQAVTGILLALYYSPSPDHAHESLRYVRNELSFGNLTYSLHRAGASFIMVTALLHLIRSYFLASYKQPRELVWISGVVLLLLLLLFAFTGQLLPFDQRGYWATTVGIEIASSAPVVGTGIRDLLTGGYGDIGATTLSRFFILHVCVLPLLLLGLISLHFRLLQKAGSAPPASGSPEPVRPFFPGQVLKDGLVAALGAIVLLLVAILANFEDSGPASENLGDFTPRPEWYFLAHYELLKLFPAGTQVLGTFVLPTLLILGMILLPLLDRQEERRFSKRKKLNGLGLLILLAATGLTMRGLATHPAPEESSEDSAAVESADTIDPIARGREVFIEQACETCHLIGGEEDLTQEDMMGPDLSRVGSRLKSDYMLEWTRDPLAFNPDSLMPGFEGTEEELRLVVQFLESLQ